MARIQWMADMATMVFGAEMNVAAALKSGPSSSEVKAFLDGSGPPCLFVAKFVPKEETDSPRDGDLEEKAAAAKPEPVPIIVAHTGLLGYPHSTAGMAEVGRICYFIRTAEVNKDIPQDTSVLFGELIGDPCAGISALLKNVTRPVCEALGPMGKSSPQHVSDFLRSLSRFSQELDETSSAMAHTVTLKMPDAKLLEASGSVSALASATSKRKKQEFAEMVAECQGVITSWSSVIEGYITTGREQPASPFEEIDYWRCRTAALTSIENQLTTKRARLVLLILSKSPAGVVDLSKWKSVDLKLTEAKNEARDNLKYLLTLERYLKPLQKDDVPAMVDGMLPILNAVKMIHHRSLLQHLACAYHAPHLDLVTSDHALPVLLAATSRR